MQGRYEVLMKTFRKVIGYISLLLFCLQASGQEVDSVINKLTRYIRATDQFSQYIPQEKYIFILTIPVITRAIISGLTVMW